VTEPGDDGGWLEDARRLDDRVFGPAPSNNPLINALMLVVRRWTAPLLWVIAVVSAIAAALLALTGHETSARDSLLRAGYCVVLAVIAQLAWKRWGIERDRSSD
jgi:hypothetical protein